MVPVFLKKINGKCAIELYSTEASITVCLQIRKSKNFSTSPICQVVAEADRYVPGLATAKSRVLKLEELAKICSVQY